MVDNPIHHGGYFNPPWWILEFTKFTCFILMICIFIFQQTQKQDGGYLNPQNKWNVGSDAFIIAQNINHKRERGVLLKATLFILTKLKMIDPYRHWRTSTDFNGARVDCGNFRNPWKDSPKGWFTNVRVKEICF